MRRAARVLVAGAGGMVGSALVRALTAQGYSDLLTPSRAQLDYTDAQSVRAFYEDYRPEYVFVAAAKVGGILANASQPADFLYDNLVIAANVIHGAYEAGVAKLLYLGSTCIYPKDAPQPIGEASLLTGPLEPTNEWYALAKIAGVKLCQAYRRQHGCNFIAAMPTNLYGPNDNFDLASAHVLPALIRKFHEAKLAGAEDVVIWGTGAPRREFLHVDDCAEACLVLMESYEGDGPINIGCGVDLSIVELAILVRDVVGYRGFLRFDETKPDGVQRKLAHTAQINALGWYPQIDLEAGIASTYRWYLEQA